MDDLSLKQHLQHITERLTYISESESYIDITDLNSVVPEALISQIASISGLSGESLKQGDIKAFFANIVAQATAGDKPMIEIAQRFTQLYDFVTHHCSRFELYEGGTSPKHIFLVCYNYEKTGYILHTTAVET